jgi:hypothetical protein
MYGPLVCWSNIVTFQDLVVAEIQALRGKDKWIRSWHEGYGLIAEEVDEFWDEVKKKARLRDLDNALKELVQISALCQRVAEDLELLRIQNQKREKHAV